MRMLQFVFDTDHLTLYERGHAPLLQRVARQSAGAVGISAVTVEEALLGRLGYLARPLTSAPRVRGYALLSGTVHLFHQMPIVPYDQAVEAQYQRLRAQAVRVGAQDLKNAAVALVHQLILLTRNRGDFTRISGIVIDDWSV